MRIAGILMAALAVCAQAHAGEEAPVDAVAAAGSAPHPGSGAGAGVDVDVDMDVDAGSDAGAAVRGAAHGRAPLKAAAAEKGL